MIQGIAIDGKDLEFSSGVVQVRDCLINFPLQRSTSLKTVMLIGNPHRLTRCIKNMQFYTSSTGNSKHDVIQVYTESGMVSRSTSINVPLIRNRSKQQFLHRMNNLTSNFRLQMEQFGLFLRTHNRLCINMEPNKLEKICKIF